MPQPARAGVNHDSDLPLVIDAELFSDLLIIDFVNFLYLQEMIAAAQTSELWKAAMLRLRAHLLRICARHATFLLKPFQIFLPAKAVLDGPLCATLEHFVELGSC